MERGNNVKLVPRADIGRVLLYFPECDYQKKYTAKFDSTKSGGHYRLEKNKKDGTPLCKILEEVILPKERKMFGVQSVEDIPRLTGLIKKEYDREFREAEIERKRYVRDVKFMEKQCIPYYVRWGHWSKGYKSREWGSVMKDNLSMFQSIAERLRSEKIAKWPAKWLRSKK